MTLSLIVAMTEEGVIGRDNKLPWHLSDDLKRFKALTMGHPVIMGRKTYDSIGRPLPGRTNIVISRNPALHYEGVRMAGHLPEAIQLAKQENGEYFVIGGAAVFREAWPLADRLYLTLIHANVPGDTYFPETRWDRDFHSVDLSRHQGPAPDSLPYSFITAVRKPS